RGELLEHLGATLGPKRPDPAEELEVGQLLGAALAQVGALPAVTPQRAAVDAAQTGAAWQVEEDGGVRPPEPDRHRPAVVPVHDPALARELLADDRFPLLGRRRVPAGAPVQAVEVDDRQTYARSELARERRLAGAGRTDHEHPAHRPRL